MDNEEIYLSVIIPAKNEEKTIGKTIESVSSYLSKQPFDSEIIVCDNGSTDNTRAAVEEKTKIIGNLKIIEMNVLGKGGAVKEGMLSARGKIRLFTDADNSTDISHFDKMKPFFDEGCEVVICSRHPWDAPGARQAVSQPFYRRLPGILGNLFIQILVLPGIWDTQCGFKAFRDFAALKIFSQLTISGWGFDVEILSMARAFGYKTAIAPAYWINSPDSKVNFKSYLQVLLETVKVRLNLWSGKYD